MNPEVAQYEALGKELLRRCMAEEEPEDLRRWLSETLARLGGGNVNAVLTWEESLTLTEQLVADYERIAAMPESERKVLSWPWQSWRELIDPLEDGMLASITAADGTGKTIYAESIAEYWAQHKNRVVFVHYELNRKLMMMRRIARHTSILVRAIKEGHLDAMQKRLIADMRPILQSWDGYISYVHTPGWTMERTIAETTRLHADGNCDVVVVDYLEKAASSTRQMRMFGSNVYQREADNVEQLKIFSETTSVPVVMIAQLKKDGKSTSFDKMDRSDMKGAGEKSDKANLVVLLKRERIEEGYSNMVSCLIDKNTMGACGAFEQYMQPEFFRVGDISNAK